MKFDKKQNNVKHKDFSNEDILLIHLYSRRNRIYGKLMFVKQIFLLTKEIMPQLFEKFEFYPSNYGPFSKRLAESIDNLNKDNYIKIESDKNIFNDEINNYYLTKKGEERAKILFEKLPEKTKDDLFINRNYWDNLGYKGILRFVYSKYPEYTIRSKIRDEVN